MRGLSGSVVLLVACVVTSAFASTSEKERAVTSALALSSAESMPPSRRTSLANAALEYWKHFDSRIPRNSPDEQKWLASELASNDTQRMNRAVNSREYALDRLVQTTTFCVNTFRSLATNVGHNKVIELYLWLKVIECYGGNEIADWLRVADLSNGRFDDTFKMQMFNIVRSAITGTVANSIIAE